MGLIAALENAQVNMFNKIGFLRKLQGVKTNSPVTIMARRSFADLGTIQKDQMLRIFHVPKRHAWLDRSKWFIPMLLPLWVGAMWNLWSQNSQILEIVESDADHVNTLDSMSKFLINAQRIAAVLIGIAGTAYLTLFPSRSVQAIYLAKRNYRRCLVVQCGRLVGSVPTYFIFDGKEEVRITDALYQQATESLGTHQGKVNEKKASDMMREYDQMIRGNKENRKINVAPVSFFGGRLVYSPNLSLCGETPRIPPAWLTLNANYGEFTINRSKLNEHAATFGLLQCE